MAEPVEPLDGAIGRETPGQEPGPFLVASGVAILVPPYHLAPVHSGDRETKPAICVMVSIASSMTEAPGPARDLTKSVVPWAERAGSASQMPGDVTAAQG